MANQVQCADCEQWIERDAIHTCKQQIRRNQKRAKIPKTGEVLNFKVQHGNLLAGMSGACRINSFEKSRRGRVVYIDTQKDDGSYVERFARFWPYEIAFAPLGSQQFEVYAG